MYSAMAVQYLTQNSQTMQPELFHQVLTTSHMWK